VVVIGNIGQRDENIDYYGILDYMLSYNVSGEKEWCYFIVNGSTYMTTLEGLKQMNMALLVLMASSD